LATHLLHTAGCLLPVTAHGPRPTDYRLLPTARCLLPAAYCLLVFLVAASASAEPWHEDFEGPGASWRRAGGDVRVTAERHQRVAGDAYAGRQCEWFQVAGQGGTSVYVSHAVGRPRVIPELAASVWVKSDRPGIQIFARVVLPRTQDPRSQTPVMLRLEGTSYSQVGRWQRLQIENLPELLARQIRGVRLQIGPQVDGHEAYVDQILLNLYGGPGTTNVWIDELSLAGYVDATPSPGGVAVVPLAALADPRRSTSPAAVQDPVSSGGRGGTPAHRRRAELVGFVLQVDGQLVLPRAISYQGESLARLKELGFNALWLSQPASPALLDEAGRLGLMVICSTPASVLASSNNDPAAPLPRIGSEYDPVVAWDLGSELSEQQLAQTRELAARIHAADGYCRRPLMCRPDSNLWDFSDFIDVLTVGQSPLATSLELSDYGRWIGYRSRMTRLKAIWSTIQTEPSAALLQQWATGGRQASLPPEIGVEQIRLVAYTAIAAGSRGLLFESAHSLEGTDPATIARAAAVELVNLELELARPWVAAGKLVGTIRSDHPDVSAAVFQYHRTRLLVPLWTGPGAQYVPGQATERQLTFVVPGVPESNRAYEITPGGLRPIKPERDTGGEKVVLNDFSLCSMVLFAGDPTIVADVRREAARIGPRAAKLYRQLAARKLEITEDVDRRMTRHGAKAWQTGENLTQARKHLQTCDGALARRDSAAACQAAERAMAVLRIVERANWQTAVASLRSPITSPATVCFSTLPWHWSLAEQTRSWQLGANLVGAGDFETFPAVTTAGWTCYQHKTPDLEATSEIAIKAAHAGRAGLRLATRPVAADAPPTLVETAPIWVTSPPVYVEAGALVRIHAWVHVPTPLTGSVDGLLVFDSMTGEALAERIGETTGWQAIALYRVVPQSGPMTVTFALCGLGEAWIDDVAIQPLVPGGSPVGQHPGAPARRF